MLDGLMMQLMGGASRREIEAPDWLKDRRVCPCLFLGDDSLWWRTDAMLVRGLPPKGVTFSHADPHVLPQGWGPTGEGRQVRARSVTVNGVVELVTEAGDHIASAKADAVSFLLKNYHSPFLFAYPMIEDEDGEATPQLIVAFNEERLLDDEGYETEETRFAPVAFISPVTENIHHILLPEDREKLPRFTGVTSPDNEHGVGMKVEGF